MGFTKEMVWVERLRMQAKAPQRAGSHILAHPLKHEKHRPFWSTTEAEGFVWSQHRLARLLYVCGLEYLRLNSVHLRLLVEG